MRPRASLIAPLLLILLGALFLIKNIRPDLPLFETLVAYWPFLLIGWGLLRIVEILIDFSRDKPFPMPGITGGEWALIILLTVVGSSIWGVQRFSRIGMHNMRIGGVEVFGEAFDYPYDTNGAKAGKTPHLVVDNQRGSVRIVGGDTEEVKVTGRKSIRALEKQEADKAHEKTPISFTVNGDRVMVQTNQDRTDNSRVTSDLEITVPRGATVEARGRYGDWDVSDILGEITINSDNAGVRIQNVGSAVRINTRKSDILRVIDAKGDVELKGGGRDVELENIAGQVTINGSFSGETTVRNISKPVRFESSVTNFRVEKVPGELSITLGNLTGTDIVGPLTLDTKSKDVRLTDVSGGVEISVERGDIELRQNKQPLPKTEVRLRSGSIEVALPATAQFTLNAGTDRGNITNDFSEKLKEESDHGGGKLTGALGTGPEIRLQTGRGDLTVRKIMAGDARPPAPPKELKAPPKAPPPPRADNQ
jgi:DUF4097 and DUF4098 domain-containing protein YvlB